MCALKYSVLDLYYLRLWNLLELAWQEIASLLPHEGCNLHGWILSVPSLLCLCTTCITLTLPTRSPSTQQSMDDGASPRRRLHSLDWSGSLCRHPSQDQGPCQSHSKGQKWFHISAVNSNIKLILEQDKIGRGYIFPYIHFSIPILFCLMFFVTWYGYVIIFHQQRQ